jgi:hypothetical protein
MASLGVEEIHSILTARSWNPRALDKRTWRCTVPTGAGSARIVIRHAGSWVYLAVIPFLDAESIKPWGTGKYPARFLGRILAVNSNLSMVKFALDDDGDLTLRVELPTESLQVREFETALSLLHSTTEQYRAPIRDALLDAGRAAEQRPSLLPEPPPLSSPPPEPNTDSQEASISMMDIAIDEPDESPASLDSVARAAPIRSDPPPPNK